MRLNLHLLGNRGSCLLLLAAILVGFLASCKTLESDDPAYVQGQSYNATIPPNSDESTWPEVANWKLGSDTGTAALASVGENFYATIALPAPPKDTIWLGLWKAGIRMRQVGYIYKGSAILQYAASRSDPVVEEILRRIRPRSDVAGFDSAFAQALVDGDSVVRTLGFPVHCPVGTDTASVLRMAMKIMVAKQLSLAAIARHWALGVDTLGIHVRARILSEAKVILDTSKLFPPYPVRLQAALTIDSALEAGGGWHSVGGSFVSTYGISDDFVKISYGKKDVTDSFDVTDSIPSTSKPGSLELTGKIWLRAKLLTAPGIYRLVVKVRDDSGSSANSSTDFQVVPSRDHTGPSILIDPLLAGGVLDNTMDSIVVKARVHDSSGVDSVWIGGRAVMRLDSFWTSAKIFVPVSDSGDSIRVRAKDRLGNVSTVSIWARRKQAPEPILPSQRILQPMQGRIFPYDSAVALVRWLVKDPRGRIDGVFINGVKANRESDSVWSMSVGLAPTGERSLIALLAVNERHDSIKGFVDVVREKDSQGPWIQFANLSDGQRIDWQIPSVQARVDVQDPSGVDSVKIDGQRVEGVGLEYRRAFDLAAGAPLKIFVEAWDKLGNRSEASLSIVRDGPPKDLPPTVALVWPKAKSGTIVPFDSEFVTIKWRITDVFGIPDTGVRISGILADRSADTFSIRTALAPTGIGKAFWITAINVNGTKKSDTVFVARAKDTVAPLVTPIEGSRTVGFDSSLVLVSWSISDNHKLASVWINNLPVAGNSGVYQAEIALQPGLNVARVVAIDSTGNRKADSIQVVRIWKDTLKPLLVRQPGTGNREIQSDSNDVVVAWKVTDDASFKVLIDGLEVVGTDGVYARPVSLPGIVTVIHVVAIDSSGNQSFDSVSITKSSDAQPPELVRTSGTFDQTVPNSVGFFVAGWKVKDNEVVMSVKINGQDIAMLDSTFSAIVPLQVGRNVMRIVASDQSGNTSTDSVIVIRASPNSVVLRTVGPKMSLVDVIKIGAREFPELEILGRAGAVRLFSKTEYFVV